jgi:type IV pilus assembly protein PilO
MQFGPRTLLFVILLLVMPIAAYMFLFKPLNAEKDAALQETRERQQKLTEVASAMARTNSLPQDIENLKKAITFLEERLPNEKQMDQVLQEVWEKASANKLNIKSVRNPKQVDGPSYSEQQIKMVIEGPFYPGFYKFLSDVEALPRLTKINEMKVEADEKNPGSITADLILSIYFESSHSPEKVAVAK